MSLRSIIQIDEERCNGCGKCTNACAEGAISIINGKAKLISETYCDGLGACLGHCPQNAIKIEQRQVLPFDEKAAKKHIQEIKKQKQQSSFVCPGMMQADLRDKNKDTSNTMSDIQPSRLSNWPVQLKLVSPNASYFQNADLLLAADCVAFAMGDFHARFLKGHSIIIGCPKLDDSQFYIEKLADILRSNKLKSLSVLHMEVPCCHGLIRIAKQALLNSGIKMTFEDVTIGINGGVISIEQI